MDRYVQIVKTIMYLVFRVIAAAVVAMVQSGSVVEDKVDVSLYYESMCPDCAIYYPNIVDIVTKLGSRVNLQTLPYGNAQTTTENGKTIIRCQHGVDECYLNEVHACAIDILKNVTAYVLFNDCLFHHNTNQCGKKLNVDTKPIKACADGTRGFELLKYYGEQTKKVTFSRGVPYTLVNGREVNNYDRGELLREVCAKFKNRPEVCGNNY